MIAALEGNDVVRKRQRLLYFELRNNILYKKVIRDGKVVLLLVVPKKLRKDLLHEAHDGLLSGHMGQTNTYSRLTMKYFWPGILEDVIRYVRTCELCQFKKDPLITKGGFLQPLYVKGPFRRIHLDYCGPFIRSGSGKEHLLLAIDPFTKYVMAQAVPAATSANAAKFLVNRVFLIHGCPEEILSDLGTHFTGRLFQEILRMLDIKHLRCTSAHPQTDGNAERALKTFVTNLSHYVNSDQRNWSEMVPFVEFQVNTLRSNNTGYTPFELVYGRQPVLPWML